MFRSVQIEGIQSKIIPGDLNDLRASHLQAKHPRQHRAAYGRLRHRLPEWASDLTRSQVELVVTQGSLETMPIAGPVRNLVSSCLKNA